MGIKEELSLLASLFNFECYVKVIRPLKLVQKITIITLSPIFWVLVDGLLQLIILPLHLINQWLFKEPLRMLITFPICFLLILPLLPIKYYLPPAHLKKHYSPAMFHSSAHVLIHPIQLVLTKCPLFIARYIVIILSALFWVIIVFIPCIQLLTTILRTSLHLF